MKTSAASATPSPATGADPRDALRQAAMAAHVRADYARALQIWADVHAGTPGAADYYGAIGTAKAAGRDRLVAELLSQGQARFPREASPLARHAEAPAWEADDKTWHEILAAKPGDRARELAAALSPLKVGGVLRKPVATVLARLDVVKQRFPRFPKTYAEELLILRRLGEYERALTACLAYRKLFPNNEKLALIHASLLDALQRYDAAHDLVAQLRRTSPASAEIETAYIHALSQLGRLEEAEAEGARAVATFTDSPDLVREYSAIASRQGDFPEALRRLTNADAKWPGNVKIKKRLSALRQQMPDLEVAPTQGQLDEQAALFARFESLGGSAAGCEFGVVQRLFGSTALGLLRWTAITLESLAEGINNGFEGLTEPGNVHLKTYRSTGTREEYMVEDDKYGFNSHTFIEVQDAPADKLLVQTIRRLGFLRGKLMEDLRIGSKIFVYKCTKPATDEAIRAVHRAIRGRGPGTFLCVMREDAAHPKGSVRELGDGLFLAYAAYFMWEPAPPGAPEIDRMTWKAICAQVAEMIGDVPAEAEAEAEAA